MSATDVTDADQLAEFGKPERADEIGKAAGEAVRFYVRQILRRGGDLTYHEREFFVVLEPILRHRRDVLDGMIQTIKDMQDEARLNERTVQQAAQRVENK